MSPASPPGTHKGIGRSLVQLNGTRFLPSTVPHALCLADQQHVCYVFPPGQSCRGLPGIQLRVKQIPRCCRRASHPSPALVHLQVGRIRALPAFEPPIHDLSAKIEGENKGFFAQSVTSMAMSMSEICLENSKQGQLRYGITPQDWDEMMSHSTL